jgi:hypothetical protein
LKCFISLYPSSNITDAEEFAKEIKKDLLIDYICQNNKNVLISYILATNRTKKKLFFMLEEQEPQVIRFFLSNIGKADASNSFFQDEIFTSRC